MSYDGEEQALTGGNVGTGIVRVGDTVRRPVGPSSASVDALLRHLEATGFEGAPRALGYDERGRQVLSFIHGRVDPDPSDLSARLLAQVGRVIREFHDAVENFVPPADAVWNVVIEPDIEQLICHNDVAPWNLVRGSGRLVIIDWDGAGPGSRLWDLSYAAHGFVPLAPGAQLDDEDAARRLASVVDGYGLDDAGRRQLVDLLARRVWSMHNLLEQGHQSGTEPWNGLWNEGHDEVWAADARYVEDRSPLWVTALLS